MVWPWKPKKIFITQEQLEDAGINRDDLKAPEEYLEAINEYKDKLENLKNEYKNQAVDLQQEHDEAITQMEREYNERQQSLENEYQDKITSLQDELARLDTDKIHLQDVIDNKKNNIKDLEVEINELLKRHGKQTERERSLLLKIEEINLEIAKLDDEINSKDDERKEIIADIVELEKKKDNVINDRLRIEKEFAEYRENITKEKSELVTNLTEYKKNVESTIKELDDEIEKHREKLTIKKMQMDKDVESFENEIKNKKKLLENKFKEFKGKLEKERKESEQRQKETLDKNNKAMEEVKHEHETHLKKIESEREKIDTEHKKHIEKLQKSLDDAKTKLEKRQMEIKVLNDEIYKFQDVRILTDVFSKGIVVYNINMLTFGYANSGKTTLYGKLSHNNSDMVTLEISSTEPGQKYRERKNFVHMNYRRPEGSNDIDFEPILINYNYADYSGERIKEIEYIIKDDILQGTVHGIMLIVDIFEGVNPEDVDKFKKGELKDDEINIIKSKIEHNIYGYNMLLERAFIPNFAEYFGKKENQIVVYILVNKCDLWMHFMKDEDVMKLIDKGRESIDQCLWVSECRLNYGSATVGVNIMDIINEFKQVIISKGLVEERRYDFNFLNPREE